VKPENILLWSHQNATVKLIDFGSACFITDQLSSYVQSRSYRAPEVVLGLPYDSKIDLWSLGCVVAELFTGRVLFQNESIVEMLALIESVCGGVPRDIFLLGCSVVSIAWRKTTLKLYFTIFIDLADDAVESQFLDFLRKLLTIDPANRLTAEDALAHPWILWGMLLTEDDVKYSAS
jgi:dual specificity tyrosine-phosphorylation-regulated kinase 2/3/4